MLMTTELPRLTNALRSFTNVSNSSFEPDTDSDLDLQSKRQLVKQTSGNVGLSWKKVVDFLSCSIIKSQRSQLSDDLRALLQVAKRIVGSEEDTESVECAAAFLFETFAPGEEEEEEGGGASAAREERGSRLRGALGPVPPGAARDASDVVARIVSRLPEPSRLSELSSPSKEEQDDDGNTCAPFGQNIPFSSDGFDLEPADKLIARRHLEPPNQLSLDYSRFVKAAGGREEGAAGQASCVDGGWLRSQVEEFVAAGSSSLPSAELCSSLFEALISDKSDNALQNELFELLGVGGFDFITKLLQQRKKIVDCAMEPEDEGPPVNRGLAGGTGAPVGPSVARQVTVQSETERLLGKAARREEKRSLKRDRRNGDDDAAAATGVNGFDPLALRLQREEALLNAQIAPILLPRAQWTEPERFPNVYDAYAEARKTSAFVGGSKMLLPEGFSVQNNKMYEELSIPPTPPLPIGIAEKPVFVRDLDEIGQLAFSGTQKLNRVQSLVFETAYHTNENLLICAPTGAGKTNVAMLTVLREVRQHVGPGGLLNSGDFKIVYVAPMKALAAEMTSNFGKRLQPLGIAVRELTGDMQLTKGEILRTQMLVTTPEKWDVVTRKSVGDVALSQLVRLLILDEVHLLHDDRGPVLESLVARTLRQVESTQSMIRIVGLSATLPNYMDVARFLHVNPYIGLFFFDSRFRPVPLSQTFIGVKTTNKMQQMHDMDEVCYDKVLEQVKAGHQVMVFVHARNATVRTAMALREMAKNNGEAGFFTPPQSAEYGTAFKQVERSRNKPMRELFPDGFSTHHAGMLRPDRSLVEGLFSRGLVRVLVCTATLAWGVNLPAHAVIIKGTQIYDAKRGTFVDLGALDVMQIFGRAGRPQYDTFGLGIIITSHDKLGRYLTLLTQQNPIESQFQASLQDNLNAEISLGTVTNVQEAVRWLSYTYLYVRMRANPLAYGINYNTQQADPSLHKFREQMVVDAGRKLDKARMIRFDERTGYFSPTDTGRTASHFYIKYNTIETFNDYFGPHLTESDVLSMVCKAEEFEQIKVREDELGELEQLADGYCLLPVAGGVENGYGKVNILLQTYISRGDVDCFSLVSDLSYIAQNAARIVRSLFETALRKRWPTMTSRLLALSKAIDRRLWGWAHPLRQFSALPHTTLEKLEARKMTVDKLRDMSSHDIGHMIHHVAMGQKIKQCVQQIPTLALEASIQPITRTVLRVRLSITADFTWCDQVHGSVGEPWWIWVEDPTNDHIYHSENFMILKKQVLSQEAQCVTFTIPIFEPLPSQYYVRAVSDRWLGSEAVCAINFQQLILPERHPPHTELLDLQPLPVSALGDARLEALYRFTHFNPVQTQIFHTLYHGDGNVLLGAPTGSGKTVAAELAIFRIFNAHPGAKAVYIAPLKALVRERMEDWKVRLEQKLGKRVVELTGDVTPDARAIASADLIVTTPEKWDGVSRSWHSRSYVKQVALLVIDEIHLLGDDRGPVLEVIVSRTNFISSHTEKPVRVVGLSTALANARDLADWLAIKQVGLFNFRPSVRPVPLEAHIHGFPGQHYCPRMATMNKPTFQAIRTHSPAKPVLIFVSSRRQTRLTALDLIAFLAGEDNPKQWLHTDETEMEHIISTVKDSNLKLCLAFGIGMHHAGLHERDRRTVEELFVNTRIQVLIATSTLAWGVNFPAHLVIIKGTEYFDGKTRRYVDFPITDVLQMMGRAGRPQFDDQGKAVIFVHDLKKDFYKKFLYEPFPVESSLLEVLADHLNAEITSGTITSKQDAMDYITWTYFFRRLIMNPSYYKLESIDHQVINNFLSGLVGSALFDLEFSGCIEVGEDNRSIQPLSPGKISSYYYLKHGTVRMFREQLRADSRVEDLLVTLSDASEYAELPVRHNEDSLNLELAGHVSLDGVAQRPMDSAHTKALLLLLAHVGRVPLPSPDYATDTKSVLDQALRVCQAMLDTVAEQGWLVSALCVTHLVQMLVQARWLHDHSLLTVPNVERQHLHLFRKWSTGRRTEAKGGGFKGPIDSLPQLIAACDGREATLASILSPELSPAHISQVWAYVSALPLLDVSVTVRGCWDDGGEEEVEESGGRGGGGGSRTERAVPSADGVPRAAQRWLRLHADQEYVLTVRLRRHAAHHGKGKAESKAQCPRFPKPKDEAWILVLGEVDRKELLALKRVGFVRGATTVSLAFYAPERTGRCIYTLYVMSDCYLGLDQQYDVHLEVIPASIRAQVNSEVCE
uniref:Activating signal cointegrator 1 complex subunit 3 n=1 Tax=Petromyzon marinus TaxID=7757 RepID=A0AAJ7U423_PETMA|nr:activating signal cointegrator 1 complex subunit 3 [Petromyzon marinus]